MEYQYKDFNRLIQESICTHWDRNALTDYKGSTLQYKDVARKIAKLHILFETAGIHPGDKIAVCGRNSSQWAVAFLAILTYRAVAVPILHEFKAEQVHNIVNHSEARLLFVGDLVYNSLKGDKEEYLAEEMPNLEGIIYIPDFMLKLSRNEALTDARERLNALYGERYPKYFRKEHVIYREAPNGEDLAMINYTSGTTSNSKGVLIPYRALWSNYDFAIGVLGDKVQPGDRIISMLPMAHMYGMAFEFIFEFLFGLHVHYLTSKPTPKVIVQAFADVKPKVVVSVPLIIENHQEDGDAQVGNTFDETSPALAHHQRSHLDQSAFCHPTSIWWRILRNHRWGCGSQQRSGTIPQQNWLQLHSRLWSYRMCSHHHIRGLE